MKSKRCFVINLSFVLLVGAVVVPSAIAQEKARRLIKKLGAKSGICVVLGDPSCELAVELARERDLLVYVQLPGSEDVDRARRTVEAAGLDATRLQIDQGDLSHLHLANLRVVCCLGSESWSSPSPTAWTTGAILIMVRTTTRSQRIASSARHT